MSEMWQWIFSIIGVVAFLMAFPFFLQLIFGQPKIGLSFLRDDTGEEGRVMKMCISNFPVDSKILRFLRVSRLTPQDIYFTFQVYDSNKILVDKFIPEINSSRSTKVDRVSLPPSILLTNVTLAKWDKSKNAMILIGSKFITLNKDDYWFRIQISIDGDIKKLKPITLHIGKTDKESVWDAEIADKILFVR